MSKVIVITGGSAGIGAASGALLASQGHQVVLVARRQAALEDVASRSGRHAAIQVADVTNRAQVRRVVDDTVARFHRIDVWINNAGLGISRNPTELTDADIDAIMRANVHSALYGMQEVLPHFKQRGEGHIINISSLLGRIPYVVIRSAYVGAKHFLNALTAMMRAEVQATHPGIQISLVSPGVVRTDFGLNAVHGGPDSRAFPETQSAEEVAAVIAKVIDTRQPDVYTRPAQQMIANYYATVGVDPQ
ncbi:MAG TPA: SDR family NAD(P)-dependent oxidoreductase [Vicinamibacterales bacterium]|jgi:NADP-dependent 3-hydroxy acid dehydrogenase YdfG